MTGHGAALNKAYRTLAKEAVSYAPIEGAAGYANARHFAFASWVADPDDIDMLTLSEELKQAEALAKEGTKVRLRSDDERRAMRQQYEQIPQHLSAIEIAYEKALKRGAYASATVVAGATFRLSRKKHGALSDHTLYWRFNEAQSTRLSGKPQKALHAAQALLPGKERVKGADHPGTLTTRYLIASCLQDTGKPQEALDAAQALLPDEERVQGEDHPDTLTTRLLIASCLQATGKPEEALDAAQALLPDEERVNGGDHPGTLTTRWLIASCLQYTGKPQEALDAAQALLPDMERVQGADHPGTLTTRWLIASCLSELDRAEDAKLVMDGVLAGFEKADYGAPVVEKARQLAKDLGLADPT